MSCKQILIIMGLVFLCYSLSIDAKDLYPFSSTQKQQQYNNLLGELRCLVCQNESLADSNAPLAMDLRSQVYRMVQQGHTDRDIKNYLVARYGDFVLFKPPFEWRTWILWLAPLGLLLLGIVILYMAIRRFTKIFIQSDAELSEQEKRALKDILRQ